MGLFLKGKGMGEGEGEYDLLFSFDKMGLSGGVLEGVG